jgi:hypothetical protein
MEGKMIESHLSYDLLPNADMKAYGEWVKNTVKALVEHTGVVEFRATRNVLGAPQVRATTVWQSLADWSKFTEGNVWQSMQTEMRTFATNIEVELWGPSPLLPNPVRPAK